MKVLRRVVILAHRYLGIAIGLLVAMWFATGILMMYAGGMPSLTPELRLDRLPALDPSRVRLTVAEAAARAQLGEEPARTMLLSVMDRPAYRFDFGGGESVTVFADTGEILDELSVAQSRTVAGRFLRLSEDRVAHVATLARPDQWTLLQGRQMPQHKFRVDDAEATELYVQPLTGEVSVMTTVGSRALAWVSAIPHWLYFTALRTNQTLWSRTVVWTAELACVLALLGLILAVTQFRRTRPLRLASAIPYTGWMRWHYITGAIFGVFTLTFAFSGVLSMEPFAWTTAEGLAIGRNVFTGGSVELSRFARIEPMAWDRATSGLAVKEVEFVRIEDAYYYVVHRAPDAKPNRLLLEADTLEARTQPFSAESLVARLRAALPDVPIVETQLLSDYDSYYYSRRRPTPLPVLRVKFADPAETWVYVDPALGRTLATVHRLNRVERWLYNGLHSLDFAFWYDSRPAWDIGMIVLCLGGLATTVLGLAMGVTRLRRGARRTARARL